MITCVVVWLYVMAYDGVSLCMMTHAGVC